MRTRSFSTKVAVLLALSAVSSAALAAEPQFAADEQPLPIPEDLVIAKANGLTAEQVAVRAAATSYTAKAADENLRAAAAKVDQAWTAFLPRLTGTAQYTHLSHFTPPTFGSGNLVGTTSPSGPIAPGTILFSTPFTIPLVFDQWLLQGSIAVPISDYFFTINQRYTAATTSRDAARYDALSSRSKSGADGKVAYYSWMLARSAVIVAVQALNDQKTHLRDARNQFAVGNASKADVLRAETAVAAAELTVERSKNFSDLSEKQMRVAMHAKDEDAMVPGEPLDGVVSPASGDMKALISEALSNRFEVKSADANAEAARQSVSASKAARYPTLGAFGDVIEGNPNQRYFPATATWNATWDVGARLVWSPNDTFLAGSTIAEGEARVSAILAQKAAVRDGIEIEVTQAVQAVHEADFALGSTARELASAEEAARVARELFNNGKGTATTVTDAETELTRGRLDLLNARANARIARVRLEHALGRDNALYAAAVHQ